MPTYGSLFSGIDGLGLGFEWAGFIPRWQVENDPKCIAVLQSHWPDIHREKDIYDVDFTSLERVDCIVGGFPCQPFSHAGKRSGHDDDRYLWPQMLRAIREQRPAFVVAENVYGFLTNQSGLAIETVYLDLEALGYEVAPPIVFPAAAIGAIHRRDRVWICAHARPSPERAEHQLQQEGRPSDPEGMDRRKPEQGRTTADTNGGELRLESRRSRRQSGADSLLLTEFGSSAWRGIEPFVVRDVHGLPDGVDRLKQLGNSVVPQAAFVVASALLSSWP